MAGASAEASTKGSALATLNTPRSLPISVFETTSGQSEVHGQVKAGAEPADRHPDQEAVEAGCTARRWHTRDGEHRQQGSGEQLYEEGGADGRDGQADAQDPGDETAFNISGARHQPARTTGILRVSETVAIPSEPPNRPITNASCTAKNIRA